MTDNHDDDHDVIDVTTAQGHLDWVRDLVAHREPEIEPDEIAQAFATEAGPDPGEVAERVIDALSALEERLEALERTINGGQDDDDEPGDRRQARA
jgi:hypothetical protein